MFEITHLHEEFQSVGEGNSVPVDVACRDSTVHRVHGKNTGQ